MKTTSRLTSVLAIACVRAAAMVAAGGLMTMSSDAGIVVTPDHINAGASTYAVTGTLMVVDAPYTNTLPLTGGPDWPEDADDGFTCGNYYEYAGSTWEPDGTHLAEAKGYKFSGGSSFHFDVQDRIVIHAVYASWPWTINLAGRNVYVFNEPPASSSYRRSVSKTYPASDLVLTWTDSAMGEHEGNFERIFTGPIVVGGGDGFTVSLSEDWNFGMADAVAIDASLPSRSLVLVVR